MTLRQQALWSCGHAQAQKIERTWWCQKCRQHHTRDEVEQKEVWETCVYVCRKTGEVMDESDTPF